jgi:hypothetical protein
MSGPKVLQTAWETLMFKWYIPVVLPSIDIFIQYTIMHNTVGVSKVPSFGQHKGNHQTYVLFRISEQIIQLVPFFPKKMFSGTLSLTHENHHFIVQIGKNKCSQCKKLPRTCITSYYTAHNNFQIGNFYFLPSDSQNV